MTLLEQDALQLCLALHAGIRVSLRLNLVVVLVICLDAFLDVMIKDTISLRRRLTILLATFGKLLRAIALEWALRVAVDWNG